jgi:hypothetical protein
MRPWARQHAGAHARTSSSVRPRRAPGARQAEHQDDANWSAARGIRVRGDPEPQGSRPAHTSAVSATYSLPPLVYAGIGRHRVTSFHPSLRPPNCPPAARRRWLTRACRGDPTTCRARRDGGNSGYKATYPLRYIIAPDSITTRLTYDRWCRTTRRGQREYRPVRAEATVGVGEDSAGAWPHRDGATLSTPVAPVLRDVHRTKRGGGRARGAVRGGGPCAAVGPSHVPTPASRRAVPWGRPAR